jgi:hypothetical protein
MNNNKKFTTLDKEIYMTCFSTPRYPTEIKQLLNKKGRTTQASQLLLDNDHSRITHLIKNNWLSELNEKDREILLKNDIDGRAKKRRYVYATLEPLLDYFYSLIDFQKNEKRQMKHLFEKKSFRPMISWELGFYSFEKVADFLVQFSIWLYVANHYTKPYRMTNKKIDEKQKRELKRDIINQIQDKRNSIAERIAPRLFFTFKPDEEDIVYSFVDDGLDKIKSPLLDKLMQLSQSKNYLLNMSISLLACGEFMEEFKNRHK